MKKIFIIDPHVADFIFIPFFWNLMGRKALLKYKYFQSLLLDKDIEIIFLITYQNSSLPSKYFRGLFFFIRKLILTIELRCWIRLNNLNKYQLIFDSKEKYYNNSDDIFVAFGYKIMDTLIKLIPRINNKSNFYIHISHYHTFPKVLDLRSKTNIHLLADNDCSESLYFKNKFPDYINKLIVLPFYVRDEFYLNNKNNYKISKVLITGTYHNIKVTDTKFDFGIYNSDNNLCLHPARYDLLKFQNDNRIDFRISEFGNKANKQKSYFKEPFSEIYKKYRYAYIPGEGTGLIAIGSLEAYCSGCIVFFKSEELIGLGLPKTNYILVDDAYDFINKLNETSKTQTKKINSDLIWSKKFSYKELSKRIKIILINKPNVQNYQY